MVAQKIQQGFKPTEAGSIPEDWETDYIKNLADIQTGARNTQDRVDDGQYPFFVRSQKVERINSYSFDGEAVLTAGDGVGTGKVFHYINGKFDFHQRVYRISNFNDRLDGYFFYLYFSNAFLARIMSMTAKSSVDSVRMDMIADMLVPLPEKGEQKAIAKVITDINGLIDFLDILVEKKRLIKQAAMQTLLTGKKRLHGYRGSWQLKLIKDFTEVTAGGTPSTFIPEYWDGNIRWMNSGELNLKKVKDVQGRITELGLKESSTQLLPPKCVLIGLAGQGKTRGTVAMNYVELCINQSIGAVFPNDSFVPEFLYYNLDSRYNELRGLSTGEGGRGGLNLTILRNIPISLPPTKAEQLAIAQLLSDMDSEIEALEQERDKCKLLKAGLMQQLLTGRIRLKWKS